jgi:hypothetical protein
MNEKLTVCCVCYPGNSVFNAYPELADKGLSVSHGICERHLRLLYPQEYLSMKKTRNDLHRCGNVPQDTFKPGFV